MSWSEWVGCWFLFASQIAPLQPATAAIGTGTLLHQNSSRSECRRLQRQHYVGSEACSTLPSARIQRLEEEPHGEYPARSEDHPEAVVGDFTHADPVRTFALDDVAFTYGGRFKQRYFTKRGDDYFPLPAQWDVAKKKWLPYHVEAGTDWWVPFYGPTNFDRPTGPTCDGCHSVNYDIETHEVTEWNVGCEKCHGPGSAHVAHPTRANIVNPARLDLRARQRRLHAVPQPGPSA